jgi:Transposase DDE domain
MRARDRTTIATKASFSESAFVYNPSSDTYRCPAGETLRARRLHSVRHTMEYKARKGICAACVLRPQCTRAKLGRTVKRHEKQAALDVARAQAHSCAARRNRRRRQQLMERSFADAANNHHFKRSRWRRLWRQQIQDHLIAAVQNVRILLTHRHPKRSAAVALIPGAVLSTNRRRLVSRSRTKLTAQFASLLRFQTLSLT